MDAQYDHLRTLIKLQKVINRYTTTFLRVFLKLATKIIEYDARARDKI